MEQRSVDFNVLLASVDRSFQIVNSNKFDKDPLIQIGSDAVNAWSACHYSTVHMETEDGHQVSKGRSKSLVT